MIEFFCLTYLMSSLQYQQVSEANNMKRKAAGKWILCQQNYLVKVHIKCLITLNCSFPLVPLWINDWKNFTFFRLKNRVIEASGYYSNAISPQIYYAIASVYSGCTTLYKKLLRGHCLVERACLLVHINKCVRGCILAFCKQHCSQYGKQLLMDEERTGAIKTNVRLTFPRHITSTMANGF